MNARTLVRLTFANPLSAIYLSAVGASIVVATAVTLFAADPGFIWVWPALFTMPTSLLVSGASVGITWLLGPAAGFAYHLIGIVVSALLQSFLLGLLQDSVRGYLRGRLRPHRG
jgi:hypothetical protein